MTTTDDLRLVTNQLCLNLLNTANWQQNEALDDHIGTFEALLDWSRRVGLCMRDNCAASFDSAALERIVIFRGKLRVLFLKIIAGENLDEADSEFLNTAFTDSRNRAPLNIKDGKLAYSAIEIPDRDLLMSVLISAIDLLTSTDHQRVKICPSDHCGWLFVDQSRTGRRKWCSIELCGNRKRARAHYARSRA